MTSVDGERRLSEEHGLWRLTFWADTIPGKLGNVGPEIGSLCHLCEIRLSSLPQSEKRMKEYKRTA